MNRQRQDCDLWPALSVEDHLVGDDRAGVDMLCRPPVLQPWPRQATEQEKTQSTQEGGKVNKNKCETALTIGDHAIAPRQAGDNDESQRDEPDCTIGQYRIRRRTPACAGAVDEPEPHGIAANGRWQRLIEKRTDHVVAEGL